jgi:L-aminopeptidase/D-esterase-like protein
MQHNIRQVAQGRFLDGDRFFAFAKANRDTHHVNGEGDYLWVSTFHVDDLVDAFKAELGEAFEAHRAEQVEIRVKRFGR